MALSMKQFMSQATPGEVNTDNHPARREPRPPTSPQLPVPEPASPAELLELLHLGKAEYEEFYGQAVIMRLCHAAAKDDVELISRMLDSNVDVNSRDYEQRTLLHVAAGAGSTHVVQELIKWQATLNSKDKWGKTPLLLAKQAKHSRVVQMLRAAGAEELDNDDWDRKTISQFFPISRSQVDLKDVLCTTHKSTVRLAMWMGTDVVVKFTKMYDKPIVEHDVFNQGANTSPNSVTTESMDPIELELLHEIKILASIRHPDLVQFLGACVECRPVMFVLEYMAGGDLEHYYRAKSREKNAPYQPGLTQVEKWASAVARALSFLHSKPIIHRDLKPMNLLLTKTMDVKVGDFGISKMATRASFQDSDKMTGGVGSLRYMAPEVVRGLHYTEKADIFSFALIMYFMASGRSPFWNMRNEDDCLKEYLKGNEPRPNASDCPAALQKIMVAAWSADPEMRPSASDLTQDFVGLSGNLQACCTVS
mmetsp:Transcript_59061/g.108579  ORF Transcript_59061/g.108579 Transcript_59061/m.108579 type:complete len:479 (+) Transcript_59061:163-1599(+)